MTNTVRVKDIDPWGRVVHDVDSLIEALYSGVTLDQLVAKSDPDVDLYNHWAARSLKPSINTINDTPDLPPEEYFQQMSQEWSIPQEYLNMDILGYLLSQCNSSEQKKRVEYEWDLYQQKNLIPMLATLKWITDVCRENDIVWGVGRGSSVSSYILYLLDVHLVDSIKYQLDIKEFLK